MKTTFSQAVEQLPGTDRDTSGKPDSQPRPALPETREPDGFCVWCHEPYYVGDATYVHPITREVHCTQACADDNDANS